MSQQVVIFGDRLDFVLVGSKIQSHKVLVIQFRFNMNKCEIGLNLSSHCRPLCLFAGAGDFYCSGNDLTNFTKIPEDGVHEMAKRAGEVLRLMFAVTHY